MLSGNSTRVCPFAAPHLLLLRCHASYIDTCCRLFYSRNAATVLGIQERLRVLEDGPLAHVSTELLELWRRQAAMDLTLPATDLALLHQHLCLPSHEGCRTPDPPAASLNTQAAVTPTRRVDSGFSALGYLRGFRVPTFVWSVPSALRVLAPNADHRVPAELGLGGQDAHQRGRLQEHQPGDDGHHVRAYSGKGACEQGPGDLQWPHSPRLSGNLSSSYSPRLGPAPDSGSSLVHSQGAHDAGMASIRWTADPSSELCGAAGAIGTQCIKCTICFTALGFHLGHKPPEESSIGRRERWLLTRSAKVHSDPTSTQELQGEESTEWRYCPERVSFKSKLQRRQGPGTPANLEQRGGTWKIAGRQQRLDSQESVVRKNCVEGAGLLQGVKARRAQLPAYTQATRSRDAGRIENAGVDLLFYGVKFQTLLAFGSTEDVAGVSKLATRGAYPAMEHSSANPAPWTTAPADGKVEQAVERRKLEGCNLDDSAVSILHWKLRLANMYCGPTVRRWSELIIVPDNAVSQTITRNDSPCLATTVIWTEPGPDGPPCFTLYTAKMHC